MLVLKEDLVKLITILRQEIALYQIFSNLLQVERQVISEHNLEKMMENNNQKETILLKLKILEETRIVLLESLANEVSIAPLDLTMSKIYEFAYEPYRTELKTCQSTLSALISSVKEIKDINRILIGRSLDLIKDSLCLINNLSQSSPSYLSSGYIKDEGRSGHIVCTKG